MDNPSPASATMGHVVRFAKGKNVGFIDPLEGERLCFHLSDCDPDYQHVHVGDQVSFEYGERDGRPWAWRVRFVGNPSLDGLRTDFERGTVLHGFLKKIGNDYYVKDVETHIFSKLLISANEVDLDEIYEGSLNERRAYRLVRMSARNALRAVLEERRFRPGLAELAAGQPYEAEVLYNVNGGYVLQLVGQDIKAFLPCKEAYKQSIPLPIGLFVNVQLPGVAGARFGDERLIVELVGDSAQKYLSPAALAAWQALQLGAIGPGFGATATVKRVVNFGAFVSLPGYGDALLHIKSLLPPEGLVTTPAQKQALGDLLADLLPPTTEVAVLVLDVDGDRCSVGLDMGEPRNQALQAEFTQRQRQLLGGG